MFTPFDARYAAAELDCTRAISLDESYIKAFHRRGTARASLKKYAEAKQDFERVLKQDAKNKQARQELEKIERVWISGNVLWFDIEDKHVVTFGTRVMV